MKNNIEIVMNAVKNQTESLQYASEKFKNNKFLAIKFVQENMHSLLFIS
jgi:hypothetical protein